MGNLKRQQFRSFGQNKRQDGLLKIETSKWIYTVSRKKKESYTPCVWCGKQNQEQFFTNAEFIDACCSLSCLLSFHQSLAPEASLKE